MLDRATRSSRLLTLDAQTTKVVDGASLRAAEAKVTRSKYWGFSPREFQALKATGTQDVVVWVTTPSLNKGASTAATVGQALAKDKTALLAHLPKISGLTLIANSAMLPIVHVKATTAAIKKLSIHPSVASLHLVGEPLKPNPAGTTTAEQQNLYWESIELLSDPPITNEVNIAMVETCHPSLLLRSHSDVTGDENDRMNYLPNTSEVSPDYCSYYAQAVRENHVKHADHTHSILYGRPDGQYPTVRGKNGMLDQLSSSVRSLAYSGIKGSRKAPGASCSADAECCSGSCSSSTCTGPCAPTEEEFMTAMHQLLSTSPPPDVLSMSMWPATVMPICTPESSLLDRAIDWMTTTLPGRTLLVTVAGNYGYEPTGMGEMPQQWFCCGIENWRCGTTGGINGENADGGEPSCYDRQDNDSDGLVDCDDPNCYDSLSQVGHWFCKSRNYVMPKVRNAVIVGAFDAVGRTGGQNPEYDRIGAGYETERNSLSSWRGGQSPHGDRILPHVVAAGRSVQAADHKKSVFSPADQFRWWGVYEDVSGDATGTSFATPQVAGLAAYVMRATLQAYPSSRAQAQQAARAILMASARHNPKVYYYPNWPATSGWTWQRSVLRTGSSDARTDSRVHRDGAGAVDAKAMAKILPKGPGTRRPQWGSWTITIPPAGEGMPSTTKIPFKWPLPHTTGYGRVRIAITWNPYVQCSGPTDCSTWGQGYDIDLCYYEDRGGNDLLMGCANSWDNNYEFIEHEMKKDGTPYYSKIVWYSAKPSTQVTYSHSVYMDAYHNGIP